jgi:beta-lactamase regulating signal transducer with metallopeptidase domain
MSNPFEQSFWLLAAITAKGALVLAGAMLAAECCRRGSAALRHALRSLGMLAAVLLPLIALVVPSWEWRILPVTLQAEPTVAADDLSASPTGSSLSTAQQPLEDSAQPSQASTATVMLPTDPEAKVSSPVVSLWSGWNWQRGLLLVWLAGAGLLAIRLGVGIARVHALLRRSRRLQDGEWLRDLAIVASDLKTTRPITLLESSEVEIPMTYGFFYPRLVVPPTASLWEEQRRRAVICHELAHVVRFDSLTQLLASVAEAVYWPNPLVWLHSRRMRIERERACDDVVLQHGARASEYANQLLEIAAGNEIRVALALPMARRSQLSTRLLALLDPKTRRGSVSKRSLGLITLATFVILTTLAAIQVSAAPAQSEPNPQPAAPSPASEATTPATAPEKPSKPRPQQTPAAATQPAAAVDPCFASTKVQQRTSIHEDDDGTSKLDISWVGDACMVKARAEGKLSFSEDGASIETITPGGFFQGSETAGGHTRSIKVTPQQGQLQYAYSVDGEPRDFDDAARTWLVGFLVGVQRVSGINAPKHVLYLIEHGGAEAVLNEVRNVQSDYVAGIYLRTMLEKVRLSPEMLRRTLQEAAPEIESDYELGRVLSDIANRYELADEPTRADFLKASSTLQSDYERARVLIQLLSRANLSAPNVAMTLNSAQRISSDYEKARVLAALASQKSFVEPMHAAYLQAASTISSDYERARILIALMQSVRLSSDSLAKLLKTADGISSDYEKARVLTATARDYKMTGVLRETYMRIARGITSESERDRAMKALGITHMML